MRERIEKLRKELASSEASAMFITDMADIRYLSGFTGSTAYALITAEEARFFTDGRYLTQSAEEVSPDISITIVDRYSSVFRDEVPKYKKILLQPSCPAEIGSFITSGGGVVFIDKKDILKRLRMIKDEGEETLIKEQYSLAAEAFLKTLSSFKTGSSEKFWAAALEYNIKILGADGTSFETIAASGERSALPHGTASSKIVELGDPVIMDFGSRQGYTSDYTRMIYGESDQEIIKVINILKTAVQKAIEGVKSGVLCRDVDRIARSYIETQGFGNYFNHSLGHGVGLDVHEFPILSPRSDFIIENGMVFTIEPGIYIPGKFGARLEETVLVKNGAAEVISRGIPKYVYKPA